MDVGVYDVFVILIIGFIGQNFSSFLHRFHHKNWSRALVVMLSDGSNSFQPFSLVKISVKLF